MIPSTTVGKLAEKIRRLESGTRPNHEPRVSSGSPAIDSLLPGGGFRRGTLVDWIGPQAGSGAGTLALAAAWAACAEGGKLVVVDPAEEFCPLAAAGLGVDLDRLILTRPASELDLHWTLEQTLRCPGVATVLADVDELPDNVGRRLQLSAELGGSIGFFLRPEFARQQPVWAEMRLWVEPMSRPTNAQAHGQPSAGFSRRLRLERLAGKGPGHLSSIELELDDETGAVRLVAPMARATPTTRGNSRPIFQGSAFNRLGVG